MSLVIALFILILLAVGAFIIYKVFKRGFQRKLGTFLMGFLVLAIVSVIAIYNLFFVKMEFIQSKTYPNLYLIKNPVMDKDSLYNTIKNKTTEIIYTDFLEKQKTQNYTLSFYEYYTGDWGERGTAYFIENKERPDGMTAELLDYYPNHLLAKFSMLMCNDHSLGNIGVVAYYNERRVIKTDTLYNFCFK